MACVPSGAAAEDGIVLATAVTDAAAITRKKSRSVIFCFTQSLVGVTGTPRR
jgi:hypothetical protein